MLDMARKVAIVTGAGSVGPGWGNGKATATLLARQGASVFLVDVNEAAAQETCGIIESEHHTAVVHRCDMMQAAEVQRMVQAAMINSDWALPQRAYARMVSPPRSGADVSSPAAAAQSGNARRPTTSPQATVPAGAPSATSAVPIQRTTTRPPILVNGTTDDPHGGS